MNIDIALFKSITDERIERLKWLTYGNETFDNPKRISSKQPKVKRTNNVASANVMASK
ncbi:hypothetical protein [Oceanobacillus arenosus]|uniref:hypothetical protein n=1 Tax=Oceanobacillus arenosus TaxID=1229153 RepID=UPI0014752AD7|nr:hypothetical protein [Oceanobacillus arenosus]